MSAGKELKPGDRVAWYGGWGRKLGTVSDATPDEYGLIEIIEDDDKYVVHPKQCRRLVKPKRKEFWLSLHPCSVPRVHARHDPELICGSGCKIEWVRVREVLPTKGKK